VAGGGHAHSTDNVQLSLWWGQGAGLTDSQLSFGTALPFNTGAEAQGYFGYYGLTEAYLPGWAAGQTWTFQVRASGISVRGAVDPSTSRSVLWSESANIQDVGDVVPGPPGFSRNSIGLTIEIPEPSSFAIIGLGLAGFRLYRRQRS
jgi:PEP-CTERM motif